MMKNRWSVILLVHFTAFVFFITESGEAGYNLQKSWALKGKNGQSSKRANAEFKRTSQNNDKYGPGGCDCQQKVACGIPNEPKCKHRQRMTLPDGRITNGFEALPHQFPWMVFLDTYIVNETYSCGGSILSPQWILTAAHCLHEASNVTVYAGLHDRRKLMDSGQLWILSKEFWLHEKYNADALEHDIAVIHLPLAFPLSDKIRPICLSPPSASYLGKYVTIAGWGRLLDGKVRSNVSTLQFAENRLIIDNKVCSDKFIELGITQSVPPGHFCLDTKSGSDPHNPSGGISICFGDSGGPIMFPEKDPSGNIIRYVQVGVNSFIINLEKMCKTKAPTMGTRVADYRKWIFDQTGI